MQHMKYIRILQQTIQIKIERVNLTPFRELRIRDYPSLDVAIEAAVEWRDFVHQEAFGFPFHKNTIHSKKRPQKNLPAKYSYLPPLGTGLSYGFDRGILRWIVVSYQSDKTTKKLRISIKEHGIDRAIEIASKTRIGKLNT